MSTRKPRGIRPRLQRFWSPRHNVQWGRTDRISFSVDMKGRYNNNGTGTWPNCPVPPPDPYNWSTRITTANTVVFGPNIKGYKQNLAHGVSATTAMTGTRYHFRRVVNSGHWDFQYKGNNSRNCSNGNGTGSACAYYGASNFASVGGALSSSPDPDALNQANSRLLNSYLSATKDWRGGNFFAEWKETVEMLTHPLKSIYQRSWSFARKVGRLRSVYRRDPIKYGKLLANAWLGYVFGVRPLFQDINEFTDALTRYQSDYKADHFTISAHGKNRKILSDDLVDVSAVIPIGPIFANRRLAVDSHVYYKGAIRAAPTYGKRTLSQFGFDAFDVIPAVWEAIPFSFLIDYFANVQEVLDSMRYWQADVKWLQLTVRNTATLNVFNPTVPAGILAVYSVNIQDAGFYTSATRVVRSQVGTLPYPGFRFKFPGVQSLKWLNVAALATQFQNTKPSAPVEVLTDFIRDAERRLRKR